MPDVVFESDWFPIPIGGHKTHWFDVGPFHSLAVLAFFYDLARWACTHRVARAGCSRPMLTTFSRILQLSI
jgi:hypothetical protein